jgi:hypothetical protein
VNRRTFLLAVGASACAGPGGRTLTPTPKSKPGPRRRNDTVEHGYYDLTFRSSQTGPSRIALHGDVLIHAVGDELRKWDATTMKRLDAWTLAPRHFCFLQDGALVVFAFPPDSPHSALYRIGASGNVETLEGPIFRTTGTTLVLPARAADEVYVTEVDEIVRLEIHGARAEEGPSMKHPAPNASNRDQLISRGDGRLVGPDREGGFRVLEPDKPGALYATPDRVPLHLAAATHDQIWYSYAATAERWNANMLVLARVETPMIALKAFDVAPGRIVHLASNGAAAVALVFTMLATDDMRGAVVVVDESGKQRWRAEVPAAFNPNGALNNGFVAISERRVVLTGPDHALLAWDAANGKPIG